MDREGRKFQETLKRIQDDQEKQEKEKQAARQAKSRAAESAKNLDTPIDGSAQSVPVIQWKVGQEVEANDPNDETFEGKYFPCLVKAVNSNGTYHVTFNDGDAKKQLAGSNLRHRSATHDVPSSTLSCPACSRKFTQQGGVDSHLKHKKDATHQAYRDAHGLHPALRAAAKAARYNV